MTTVSSELEKMLSGELYLPADPALVNLRKRARRLTRLYNQTMEDEQDLRDELLKDLFGATGPRSFIEPPFYCDYGAHIFAGEGLYMNFGCVVLDCAEVRLGRNVYFGPNVQIYTAYHPLDAEVRSSGPELASAIRIGDDCWIGGGAIICPGVTIGDGTTIGAGSVVTKDIPAHTLAVGNPCRPIRQLKEAKESEVQQ